MHGQVLEITPSDAERAMKVLHAAQEAGKLSLESVEMYGALIHVTSLDVKASQRVIKRELREANIDPGSMTVVEPSLEDVFIACMR